jgi:hypothetical protein
MIIGRPILGATNTSYDAPTNTIGSIYYYCTITNTDNEVTGLKTATSRSDSARVTVTAAPPSFTVSGLVESYDPKKPANVELWQNNQPVYTTSTTITPSGSGQADQPFTFSGVVPGTYDLVVTKDLHTKFTVKNVVVNTANIDLTQDARPEVQLMTLRCGDINGDGYINNVDLGILWLLANYNRNVDAAAEPRCDLNGDGYINNVDLGILWLAYN